MDMDDFIVGFFLAIFLFLGVAFGVNVFTPRSTSAYKLGVLETQRQAFDRGFMTKEVDKNDKIIYRWVESEKQAEKK